MKKKLYYGWIVVFACMMLAGASTGMLSFLSPLFVAPVTEALGVSRASFMVYQTFSTLTTVIVMPLVSSVYGRLPMKPVIIAGACLGASAHLCYSLAYDMTFFYLGGMLAGAGTCLCGSLPVASLTSRWFHEKKGVATGLAFAGTGLVASLMSPVVSGVIADRGWRWGYRLIAVMILLVVVPVTLFLIRESPEEMGLRPYGAREPQETPALSCGFSRRQLFRTFAFWPYALGVFFIGMTTAPSQQQLVAYWISSGNTAAFAALMYSVVMFAAIFAKILLGIVYDRNGVTCGTLMAGAAALVSFLVLWLLPQGYAVLIPAVLFAITVSVQVLVGTYVANRLFGDREYTFVYGLITPVLYSGVAVGSPLSAAVYDVSGSYGLLWSICAAVFSLGIILTAAAGRLSVLDRVRFSWKDGKY